jgi:hypothetical protein
VTEQPKYHCRRCASEFALGVLAEEGVHRARRDAIAGVVILVVAVVIAAGVAVGSWFALRAVLG